jgi:hypothetical protein
MAIINLAPITCGMPLIVSNSLAKTSNLSWKLNKDLLHVHPYQFTKFLAITHGVFYDPHSTPRVHNVFLVLSFCNDIATLLSIQIHFLICMYATLEKWT